jgi:hypothetical protein
MSDVGGGIRPMKRLEALNAVYDRFHDRIVAVIMVSAYVTDSDLLLLENRFQFARSLRS